MFKIANNGEKTGQQQLFWGGKVGPQMKKIKSIWNSAQWQENLMFFNVLTHLTLPYSIVGVGKQEDELLGR